MNIKPIRGQVIVLPDPPPEASTIIITPDTVKADNPNYFTETGRVVALAEHSYSDDGEEERPFDVEIGNRVHFNRYAGKQVTCEDDSTLYLVMFEKDITAIVDDGHTVLHGYEAPKDEGVREYKTDPFAEM